MIRRLRLPTEELVYVSDILESYEDLAVMTTLERLGGVSLVELRGPDDMAAELERLLAALAAEGVPVEEGG